MPKAVCFTIRAITVISAVIAFVILKEMHQTLPEHFVRDTLIIAVRNLILIGVVAAVWHYTGRLSRPTAKRDGENR